ncbi:MAG: hypothetical protein HFI70_14075 [Lachnospiraceae bacterium]|nr:hypothetical protein [Lachnospiraceae bacterium]
MADIHKEGLNAELIGDDLEKCCRGEEGCAACQGSACNIGFAKQCVRDYIREPKKEVSGGASRIPTTDFKLFDEVDLEVGIAHILKECKDCKGDHTEDCIINVIRNCYEVSLLGDIHPYEGSTLQYLMYLKDNFSKKAEDIAGIYTNL